MKQEQKSSFSPPTQDYGHLMVGSEVGLSSGPLLAHSGKSVPPLEDHSAFTDDRFKYRLGPNSQDNPRNKTAGVLTHSSDPNFRSAISIQGEDAFMQTLTPKANLPQEQMQGAGATMKQWQAITTAGAGIGRDEDTTGATLNLDGGGSVFMGIHDKEEEVRQIAKGVRGNPNEIRPVANIIASRPHSKYITD